MDEHPISYNVEATRTLKVYLRLQKGTSDEMLMDIHDWLDEKGHILEWTLDMNKGMSCQGKTKHMQEELLSCPDEAIMATAASIKGW